MMPVRRNQNWLPSIFNDFFGNEWVDKSNVTAPAVNILETEDDFNIEVAAPGMTKEIIQAHAAQRGESVNAYINRAIDKAMSEDDSST